MASKRHSPQWLAANTAWRRAALSQIEHWVKTHGQGPYTDAFRRIMIQQFAKLEQFLDVFFPGHPPAPFAPEDAAALIVLPRHAALRIARKLFRGGPGIAGDLHAEDLVWNLAWFTPTDALTQRPYAGFGRARTRR